MRDLELPGRSPAHATHAMAATSHTLSTQTAMDVLRAGGNAMDAAIAACAVQCVVEPESTGVGGDCFALWAPAGAGVPVAFNGSGKAPTGATCEYYAAQGMTELPRQSPHACVVPGAVDAWCRLNADHGRLPLADLLAPAIGYARDGYPIASRVSADWEAAVPILRNDPNLARIFLVDGERAAARNAPPPAGTRAHHAGRGGRRARRLLYRRDRRGHGWLPPLVGRPAHDGGFRGDQAGDYVTPDFVRVPRPPGLAVPAEWPGGDRAPDAEHHGGGRGRRGPHHRRPHACRDRGLPAGLYRPQHVRRRSGLCRGRRGHPVVSRLRRASARRHIDMSRARDPMPEKDLVRHDDTVYISAWWTPTATRVPSSTRCSRTFGAGLCAPKSGVVFTNRATGLQPGPRQPQPDRARQATAPHHHPGDGIQRRPRS